MLFLFFFQAEDGIRDYDVTGVQTCALPISKICPAMTAYTNAWFPKWNWIPLHRISQWKRLRNNARYQFRITWRVSVIVCWMHFRKHEPETYMATYSPKIIEAYKHITTATLSTVLLKKGLKNVWIRGSFPIAPNQSRTVGPAFTLRFIPAQIGRASCRERV